MRVERGFTEEFDVSLPDANESSSHVFYRRQLFARIMNGRPSTVFHSVLRKDFKRVLEERSGNLLGITKDRRSFDEILKARKNN